MSHIVYISIGSNILPHLHLPKAIEMLGQQLSLLEVSSVYETPPVGTGGRNFLNAVVVGKTNLQFTQLKEEILRPIENALGRQRSEDKFAPRTIDLDIIAWDGKIVDQDAFRYAHLAVPLAEVIRHYPLDRSSRRIRSLARHFLKNTPLHSVAYTALS